MTSTETLWFVLGLVGYGAVAFSLGVRGGASLMAGLTIKTMRTVAKLLDSGDSERARRAIHAALAKWDEGEA